MTLSGGEVVLKVVADTSTVGSQIQSDVQSSSSGIGSKLKSIGSHLGSILGVGLSVGAAVSFGKSSLTAFEPLQKAQERLQVGLNKIHQPQGMADILDWSKNFSLQTGINQADIVDISSKLETFGQSFFKSAGPQASGYLDDLTSGFENMAAATGKSTSMLMRSLGPAILNTPAKAISSLQKYGAITKEQDHNLLALTVTSDDQLKGMVKSGAITQQYAKYVRGLNADQRQHLATTTEIEAVQGRFNGVAAKTSTSLEILSNYWNQIKLVVGKFISEALDWIVKHLPGIIGWFEKWKNILIPIAAAIGIIVAAWLAYTGALKIAAAAQAIMNAVMAINPFVLLAAAVVLVALLIIKNWSTVKKFTLRVWNDIKKFVVGVWNGIKKAAATVWHALYKVLSFTPLVTLWKAQWAILLAVIKAGWAIIQHFILPAVMWVWNNVFKPVFKLVGDNWKTLWNGAKDVFSTVWGALVGIAKPIIDSLIIGLNGLIDGINTVISGYNLIPGHSDIGKIPQIPLLDTGGYIEQTGIAVVHRGETVIPANHGMGNMNVTVAFDESGNLYVKRTVLDQLDRHDEFAARQRRMNR